MLLQLIRNQQVGAATTGMLLMPNEPPLYTIERPWQDNDPDISCAPVGTYELIPYLSPEHGLVWRLHNPQLNIYGEGAVPAAARSGLEIHALNFARESKGCIGPGLSGYPMLDPIENAVVPAVQDSAAAMARLRASLGVGTGHQLVISVADSL